MALINSYLFNIHFLNYENIRKHHFITGAASGIGLEIARLSSQHNNKIIFRNIIKRPAIHSV
jgi:hypothetical protein